MKAIVIGLSLTAAAGAALYLISADEPAEGPTVAEASDEARPGRRRAGASARERARRGGDDEPARDGTLEERVTRLEDEVRMLRRQLALRGRVAVSGGSADVESIVDDPVLEDEVRSIVEDEREAERERSNERRAERFAEFRQETLDELVKVAGLSEDQRQSIDGLWTTEAERIIPLIAEARSGDRSFREVREELDGIRKETDEAVEAMLSESQFEHYDGLRPRGPGGRRGRDGGGRGPGGPGGPPPPG